MVRAQDVITKIDLYNIIQFRFHFRYIIKDIKIPIVGFKALIFSLAYKGFNPNSNLGTI